MTSTSLEEHRTAALGSPNKLKTAVASAVGTTVENYDFLAFGTASALYFGAVFFPSADPIIGTLLAFATFGVGFVARPLGGAIGGHLGDKYGRKPVLVASLLVMGGATVLIGVMPTYEQVGVLAPILLVIIRLIQGLAFGAEWGGAMMMTFEHAPWRNKGGYSAIPQAGSPTGIALATVVFLACAPLGNDWSWRIPFLASAALIVLGLYVRLKLEESPDFENAKQTGEILKNPLAVVVRKGWRDILRVIALRLVESCGYYVTATFLLSYITENNPENRQIALSALLAASIVAIPAVIVAGIITDRVGRKKVYLAGVIAAIAFGFPMFWLAGSGNTFLIVAVYLIGVSVIWSSFAGTQGAWFGELFPTNTRNSGVSLGYQLAASVSGFAPFLAALTVAALGSFGGSVFYMIIAVIGLVGVLTTRETWGTKERARVDAILKGHRVSDG